VGEDVNLEIQIVNVGKEPVLMNKVENILPLGFELVSKPDYCSVEGTAFIIKGKKLSPLITEEIKISLKSFIKGSVEINPRIICFDETGHQITCKLEPITFNFLEAALPGRISSGYSDLDNLLLGGIPENYAVILTSPSSDEKEELIKKFLQAGLINGQTTFYITGKLGNVSTLAEKFKSTFYLFICNPRAEIIVQNMPNVFKLKGIDSLTDIDIALTKSFRTIDTSHIGPRRVCIEIISDVLLQHHAVITRKWLSGLLPDLKSKGFTTLAVINPEMHPQEEVQAILGLFEGEIKIIERETDKGSEKILRIRKLYNQKYLDTELVLKKEKMEI
jgi:KaiC/GvpD/RAD55 family RecA-like ATPase